MNSVPFDFPERVSALWQCCPAFVDCDITTFKATEKWSFSEKIHVTLVFAFVGGKVKYGFSNPDYVRKSYHLPQFVNTVPIDQHVLTMDGLRKRRDFKHIQIGSINLYNKNMSEEFREIALRFLDVELRTLLKFVSYLSNAPVMIIRTLNDLLDTPDGIIIKNWVEDSSFSVVRIVSFTSADQRLVENQFQKANPAIIRVEDVSGEEDKHFLEESLRSGQLRMFRSETIEFPFEVLEGMIANYQQNPEDYTPDKYMVWLNYDKTMVDEKLTDMAEMGLCDVEDGIYCFHSNTMGTTFCVEYKEDQDIYSVWVDDE